MDLSFLPAVNAALNAAATACLIAGRRWIRRGDELAHRRAMLGATGLSVLFLFCYVLHKASRGFENTSFNATGAAHSAYLALLFSHLVLAMTIPIFALRAIWLGVRGERARHRRLVRVAWPIWLYVSLTGIAIYVLLYHLNPDPALRA